MPSDTFFRLPEEKRQRIFEAALDEFSAHRFSESSINRIVKAAGIPRGSFYQYFVDKEDLYAHVLQHISNEKIGIIAMEQLGRPGEIAFFELLKAALPTIFAWAERNPRYTSFALMMISDDSEFIRRMFGKMSDSISFVRDYLLQEQRLGRIRAGVRVEAVIQFIISVSLSMLRDYYESGSAEEAISSITAIYDIICYGIMTPTAVAQ